MDRIKLALMLTVKRTLGLEDMGSTDFAGGSVLRVS